MAQVTHEQEGPSTHRFFVKLEEQELHIIVNHEGIIFDLVEEGDIKASTCLFWNNIVESAAGELHD